jgi:uncharacterized protein (TIRG00374 family)
MLRIIGPLLFVVLLATIDPVSVWEVLRQSHPGWLVAAVAATPVMLLIKTARWRAILGAQKIRYPLGTAFLSYYVCLFVGILTPGRLGEFIRALHLVEDRGVDPGRALSSVAADRLFDLYALLFLGTLALGAVAGTGRLAVAAGIILLILTGSLVALLRSSSFGFVQKLGASWGRWTRHLTADDGFLAQLRSGLLDLDGRTVFLAGLLTLLAYGLFFAQCYWLALSLSLPIGILATTAAVALGSLVTLIPVSVAGLGTREAAMVAYLTQQGVTAEGAFGFSVLMFANFYLISSAVGAVLSLFKPVSRAGGLSLLATKREDPELTSNKPELDVGP